MNKREKRNLEMRDIIFNGGNNNKCRATKVPRQCPLVLLVKIG
jgi:hypothetical protein